MDFINTDEELIDTGRLILRKFRISDINDMIKNWISYPEVQSCYGEPIFTDRQTIVELLEKWSTQYRWAIILKEMEENIGHVSFCRLYEVKQTAEIEYCIGKSFWGKGFATEAVRGFIEYTFRNTKLSKLEAFHMITNPASGRVLQKSGMSITDNILRFSELSKAPDGDICYAITKEQFSALQ